MGRSGTDRSPVAERVPKRRFRHGTRDLAIQVTRAELAADDSLIDRVDNDALFALKPANRGWAGGGIWRRGGQAGARVGYSDYRCGT